MPDAIAERRSSPRFPLVLAVEVVELPRGARMSARTSDMSRTGCYVDTLNPLAGSSQLLVRIAHHEEVFEAVGQVAYVIPRLGMGVSFENVRSEESAKLNRWLEHPDKEF
jgi:hypothetical protein